MSYPSIVYDPLSYTAFKNNIPQTSSPIIIPFAPSVIPLIQPAVSEVQLTCPVHLNDNEPTPPGFKPYYGNSSIFHCGFRAVLEDRLPTLSYPQNECVYDHTGILVNDSHAYAGCKGTPDSYDSETSKLKHVFIDPGGVVMNPGAGFTSLKYYIDRYFENEGQRILQCQKTCEELPWYVKTFCLQSCNPQAGW